MFDVKRFHEQMFKKFEQTFLFEIIEWSNLPDVGKFGHAVVLKGSGSEIRAR